MKILITSVTAVVLSANLSFAGDLIEDGLKLGATAAGGYLGGPTGAAIGATLADSVLGGAEAQQGAQAAPVNPTAQPNIVVIVKNEMNAGNPNTNGSVDPQNVGNRCKTPFGISGYGPINALGSRCKMGEHVGYVVR